MGLVLHNLKTALKVRWNACFMSRSSNTTSTSSDGIIPFCYRSQKLAANLETRRGPRAANIVHIGSAFLQTSAELQDPVYTRAPCFSLMAFPHHIHQQAH